MTKSEKMTRHRQRTENALRRAGGKWCEALACAAVTDAVARAVVRWAGKISGMDTRRIPVRKDRVDYPGGTIAYEAAGMEPLKYATQQRAVAALILAAVTEALTAEGLAVDASAHHSTVDGVLYLDVTVCRDD